MAHTEQAKGAYRILRMAKGCAPTLTAVVYRLAPPTTAEARWSRLLPELLATYPLLLYKASTVLSTGYYWVTWNDDPPVLPA